MSDEDDRFIELIGWLERAGHETDMRRIFAQYCNDHRMSCRKMGYYLDRIETEGVLEACFWFPFFELEKVCPITDTNKLKEWLDAISVDGIEATTAFDVSWGQCVLIKRLHFIPQDRRESWISRDILPEADFTAITRLLNMENLKKNPIPNVNEADRRAEEYAREKMQEKKDGQ